MHPIKLRYVLFLLIWLPVAAFAQLKKYGPGRQAPAKISVSQQTRQQAGEPLSLPFWDDFSFASGYPVDSLWAINHSVFVNDGQGINPPSLNVATFDGYNENGLPYSSVPDETGYADTLESQPIKLADVPPQYQDSVYLSFFYQLGGNSDIPNPGDFLILEFKTTEGWEEIHKFEVESNADPTIFNEIAIQIPNDPKYFHNDFQFRFISYGKISGSYDAWQLDYVYLNRRVNDNEEVIDEDLNINELDKNTNISDRAIVAPFTSIFNHGYYAIPYKHFLEDVNNNLKTPELTMFNLIDADFPQVTFYTSYFTITNFTDDVPTTIMANEDFTGSLESLPSREYAVRQIPQRPGDVSFSMPADVSEIQVKIGINSGDNDASRDYFSRYSPIDFRVNDTIRQTFTLSNYYAYDDGIAEYSMALVAQGNQFAYRFVMDDDVEMDTINGAYIYFPYAGGTVPETMQIFIFPDKGGKPDSAWIYRQTIPVTRTANNLFSEINFTQGVIVRDTFYIGYLETETGDPDRIRIGLDASHDTGDQMYVRNSVFHQWRQNDELKGSAMIRPRFGKGDIITGVDDEPNPVSIYPNPSRGEFYMKGPVDNLQIMTLTGQSISFSVEQALDVKKIQLSGTVPGLYIVRYRAGSKIYTNKILVRD